MSRTRLPLNYRGLMKDRGLLLQRAAEARERDNKSMRESRRNRRHRMRAPDSPGVKASEWEEMVDLCDNICIAPGCRNWPVTQDHVVPVSRGGLHEIGNIQPLCMPCNNTKGVDIIDYRPGTELERFIQNEQ